MDGLVVCPDLGVGMVAGQKRVAPQFHMFYGFVAFLTVGIAYSYRQQMRGRRELFYGLVGLFIMGLGMGSTMMPIMTSALKTLRPAEVARGSTLLNITFPGGAGAKVWTFVTYSLLHANLSHIGFNVLWLLPFGSALARRFGLGEAEAGPMDTRVSRMRAWRASSAR